MHRRNPDMLISPSSNEWFAEWSESALNVNKGVPAPKATSNEQ